MGKVRKHRRKLHQNAVKIKKDTDINTDDMQTDADSMVKPVGISEFATSGLFDDTKIDISKLASLTSESKLDEFDTRSAITSKSFRGLNATKKEKRKIKKEFWMNKISAIKTMKQEEKDKKKRKNTVVVGDMKPLEDTLPTLELLMRDTATSSYKHSHKEENHVRKSVKKSKQRHKDMMSDISLFKQVLHHPAYKADPMSTISEHLHNKHKLDQMQS